MNATKILAALISIAAAGCLAEPINETSDAALNGFDPSKYVCEDPMAETTLIADCQASCDAEREMCLAGTGGAYRRWVARSAAASAQVDWSTVDNRIAERAAQYDLLSCTQHFEYAVVGAEKLVQAGAIVDPAIRIALGAFDTAFCGVYETLAVIGDTLVIIGTEIVQTIVAVWYQIQEPFQRLYRWLEEQGCENQHYACTQVNWWDSDNDGAYDMTGCPGFVQELSVRCNPGTALPTATPNPGPQAP